MLCTFATAGVPYPEEMLDAFAVLLCLTALLAFVNERFVRLPATVGVALGGMLVALLLSLLAALGLKEPATLLGGLLTRLDFSNFVLNGVLSLLLFAGALGLDTRQILAQWRSILTLAVGGTLLSTALIGGASGSACTGADFRCPDFRRLDFRRSAPSPLPGCRTLKKC